MNGNDGQQVGFGKLHRKILVLSLQLAHAYPGASQLKPQSGALRD